MTEVLRRADPDLPAIEAQRARIRQQHLHPSGERPASSARIELIADPVGERYGHQVL